MTDPIFADVAPAVPLPADKRQVYTYRLSRPWQARAALYAGVTVPFGQRQVPGVLIRLLSRRAGAPVRPLASVADWTLTAKQVRLARTIARLARGGLGYTLRLFRPARGSGAHRPAARWPCRKPLPVFQRALVDYHLEQRHHQLARVLHEHIAIGQQVAVIVPEQGMVQSLAKTLTASVPARCALVHTQMSMRTLAAAWHQTRAHDVDVIIGTQKALYYPFHCLGLIVIEEEGFEAHKQWHQYPRLHNRDAAAILARVHHASLLYTSSFPSLWLQYHIAHDRLVCVSPKPLPLALTPVRYSSGDRRQRLLLPSQLMARLRHWLTRGERVLLVYNRRRRAFLEASLASAGLPTKGQLVLATSAFTRLGQRWQRIVWLWPETYLRYPDFRSPERLLMSAARLQRLIAPSRLNIVTRRQAVADLLLRPTNQVMTALLSERQRLSYPPFSDLVKITVTGTRPDAAWQAGIRTRQRLEDRAKASLPIKLRGPYRGLSKASARPAVHLLLAGPLDALVPLYDGLPGITADVSPASLF